MCRNIRTLHNFQPPATDDEIRAAALQYVRKVSGSTKPSRANAEAFDRAVDEIAIATGNLLEELVASTPPKDRELEAAPSARRAPPRASRPEPSRSSHRAWLLAARKRCASRSSAPSSSRLGEM
jgi:hypothetical protein